MWTIAKWTVFCSTAHANPIVAVFFNLEPNGPRKQQRNDSKFVQKKSFEPSHFHLMWWSVFLCPPSQSGCVLEWPHTHHAYFLSGNCIWKSFNPLHRTYWLTMIYRLAGAFWKVFYLQLVRWAVYELPFLAPEHSLASHCLLYIWTVPVDTVQESI